MSLLVLDGVTKRIRSGRREAIAVHAVSMDVAAGELVAVWGTRRSGRSTLLRLAAGIEQPDEGAVRFDGRDLADAGRGLLGSQIGYASTSFHASQGGTVLDHVAVSLLARGVPRAAAATTAAATLERVGAGRCVGLHPDELDPAETVRVAIARAVAGGPRLLLLDDPTNGVDLLQRDPLVRLLRELADAGVAVLLTTGETIAGADRVLSLAGGVLRGESLPESAPVVPLRAAQPGR